MVQPIEQFASEISVRPPATTPDLSSLIDRWIYVFMAALLIVVTLLGFVPDSIMKVGMVEAGQRLPFPLVLHLHAIAMGSWLLLLLAQTSLMASGRREGHKQLGMIALVLARLLSRSALSWHPPCTGSCGAQYMQAPAPWTRPG